MTQYIAKARSAEQQPRGICPLGPTRELGQLVELCCIFLDVARPARARGEASRESGRAARKSADSHTRARSGLGGRPSGRECQCLLEAHEKVNGTSEFVGEGAVAAEVAGDDDRVSEFLCIIKGTSKVKGEVTVDLHRVGNFDDELEVSPTEAGGEVSRAVPRALQVVSDVKLIGGVKSGAAGESHGTVEGEGDVEFTVEVAGKVMGEVASKGEVELS